MSIRMVLEVALVTVVAAFVLNNVAGYSGAGTTVHYLIKGS